MSCSIALMFLGLLLICPVLCHPKPWECNENDPDFKECMKIILPDILRRYYIDYEGVEHQMDTESFLLNMFFGKNGENKYRCRGSSLTGFDEGLVVTNYVTDWDRYELKITTFHPRLTVDSSYCTYGNLHRKFAPFEGSHIETRLYQVTMMHTLNLYFSRKGKVYIQDWKIQINPYEVYIDHPEKIGISDKEHKGFAVFEKALSKVLAFRLKNFANHVKNAKEVPETY